MKIAIFPIVSPSASISSSSINQTYLRENVAILECTSVGGPNNLYQWQVNGSDIPGATASELTLSNLQGSDGGEYTCVVSNAAGSDSASTFVYISPYFVIEPTDAPTSSGDSVMLTCEAEAFPSPQFQWVRADGRSIRNEIMTSTNVLVIDPVIFGDEGAYICLATSLDVTRRSLATITGISNVYKNLHLA